MPAFFLDRLYAGIDAFGVMKDVGNILRNAQRSRGDGHQDWESRSTLDRSSSNRKGLGCTARNLYLYQKAKLQPVELSITKTRWRLFFKMLQLQPPHQIHCIMEEYFHKPIRQPGAPASSVRRSTLPWALHKELQLIGKSLLSWDDFQTIRNLAAHPEEWRVMVKKIVRKMKRRFFFQEDRDYKRGRKARMKAKQKRLREEREAMLGRTREAGPARSSCRGRRRGPRFSRI